jgi:hypothetical protein
VLLDVDDVSSGPELRAVVESSDVHRDAILMTVGVAGLRRRAGRLDDLAIDALVVPGHP